MPGKFEIFQSEKNEKYYFRLKAGNGQVILASQGYTSKGGCKNGVESVQTNAPTDERYDRKVAKDEQVFFNLTASNGQIIGSSEMYTTVAARENGINSVKKNAPTATLVDLTEA